MINWLRNLLIRPAPPVEVCRTCVVLEAQLEYERSVNKELTETLTSLLKPRPIIQQEAGQPRPLTMPGGMWSRRRKELERVDKERMKLEKNSQIIAKPDEEKIKVEPSTQKTIDELEKELGIPIDSEHEDKPNPVN